MGRIILNSSSMLAADITATHVHGWLRREGNAKEIDQGHVKRFHLS